MTKEEKSEYNKKYYVDNKKRELARCKIYKDKHKERGRKQAKQWKRDKIREGKLMICWMIERYEGTPCMDCIDVFPWECMDFDHRPEETKSFAVSQKQQMLITSNRIAQVEKEIAKCDLVCANCHRIRTKVRTSCRSFDDY